jgi:hypothetical protein
MSWLAYIRAHIPDERGFCSGRRETGPWKCLKDYSQGLWIISWCSSKYASVSDDRNQYFFREGIWKKKKKENEKDNYSSFFSL